MSEQTQPPPVVVWDEETRARAGEIACRDCEACGGTCSGPREDMWCGAAAGMAERIRQAVRGRRVLATGTAHVFQYADIDGNDQTQLTVGLRAGTLGTGVFHVSGRHLGTDRESLDVLILAREEGQ